MARSLLQTESRSIALLALSHLPLGSRIAEQLSRCVADLSLDNVALLSLSASFARAPATGHERDSIVQGRWLASRVALIGPTQKPRPGQALSVFKQLLAYAQPRAQRVIADLSDWADLEEALAACHLFEGTVFLVRAGETRERPMLRALRELPPERRLGAVLIH